MGAWMPSIKATLAKDKRRHRSVQSFVKEKASSKVMTTVKRGTIRRVTDSSR